MFDWKLIIAIVVLIVFLFINKRESFDDISRNILIDKSLTNYNGKTLIEIANGDVLDSTLGYLDNLNKSFQQYPESVQNVEDIGITKLNKMDELSKEKYKNTQLIDELSDISANIGICIQKYYTNGSGTPQAEPTDFSMFQTSKYLKQDKTGVPVTDLIAILNRLRQSFARTMNAINIHNYNLEKAYGNNNIVNMRADFFKGITKSGFDNDYVKNQISKYKVSDPYPKLSLTVYKECINETTPEDRLKPYFSSGKNEGGPFQGYTDRNVFFGMQKRWHCESTCAGNTQMKCWEGSQRFRWGCECTPYGWCFHNCDDRKYDDTHYTYFGLTKAVTNEVTHTGYDGFDMTEIERTAASSGDTVDPYVGMKSYTSNQNMINNSNVTNFIGHLELFITLSSWSGTNGMYTPLKSKISITLSNYTTASYYNSISIGIKVFENMIMKYRPMIFSDSISLNLNPPPFSTKEWLTTYSKNTIGNWDTLYTTQT